ncbi:MAG: hypothetical protein AAF674_01485 [Pseudomonadota bacterium]
MPSRRSTLKALGAATLTICGTAPSWAGERGAFDRHGSSQPLRFRNADGGAFRPVELVLVTDRGTFGAILPENAEIQDEDRVDLSGLPVVGGVFKGTTAPSDARDGLLIGPVERIGDMLVIRAAGFPDGLERAPVTLSTSVPRFGLISYPLGRLNYRPVVIPAVVGQPLGQAHLLDGQLVVASDGGEPAYPSVDALVKDLFD